MRQLDPADSFIKHKLEDQFLINDFAPLIFDDKLDKITKVRLGKAIGVVPQKIQIENLSDFLKESVKKTSFCEVLMIKVK